MATSKGSKASIRSKDGKKKSRRELASLPLANDLERICKGIALLDAMVCEDWESRYYSFNQDWDTSRHERLASMRNGSGDEWFLVFSPKEAFLKCFWHEYQKEDEQKIFEGLPDALVHLVAEEAFSPGYVTFGGWSDGQTWVLRGNAKPLKDELAILSGDAKSYQTYVSEVLDVELDLEVIEHVLSGKPVNKRFIERSGVERSFEELQDDLNEIGY